MLLESNLYMLKVYFSEVLKKYTFRKHERSTKKYTFQCFLHLNLSLNVLNVYFSKVLISILLWSMKKSTKKYTFLVLLASENCFSPKMLKVCFFHASSLLHFTRNCENFQFLKFVKSSRSMLKVYFSEVLKKYTSQKHERSTKKWIELKSKCA